MFRWVAILYFMLYILKYKKIVDNVHVLYAKCVLTQTQCVSQHLAILKK